MILLTGASGFVGQALAQQLQARAIPHRLAVRRWVAAPDDRVCLIGAIDGATPWAEALRGVTTVIHAAARVHVMRERAAEPLAAFRAVNVAGTVNLARQAAAAGVRRFVFISSIKVNGEETADGRPFTARDVPAPQDAYGISKLEAEEALRALARDTGLDVVVIRPVLVYGPGVRANFHAMLRWLHRGVPLPLGAIHNRRSLVALDNLADLVIRTLTHPAAANGTFLVSDGEDLSTTELLRRMADALGVPARLLPVPVSLLKAAARALGQGAVATRLCGSLQVDITETRALLGWTPPVGVDEALARVAADFIATHGR